MKKIFLIIMVIVVGVFLSFGCVTKQVWTDKRKNFPYAETIISFYSNAEKKEVLFIGEKYHYIFNKQTKQFIELLKRKEFLKLTDRELNIYASIAPRDSREISAQIEIQFKENELNKAQKEWLLNKADGDGRIDSSPINYFDAIYSVNYNIRGTRYRAKSEVNAQVVKLQKPIPLTISEYKLEKKSTLYKVAMTPLSVTADAALVVVGVGAAIVYAPFALGHWAIESVTK